MPGASSGEDTRAVRAFFDQWGIYKKVVDCNFLRHREAMSSVEEWLRARAGGPGRFLDLGCGDAAFTSRLLFRTKPTSYTGVDCSPIALDLAAQNLRGSGFPTVFVCEDFVTMAERCEEEFDVVFIGLSLHHLQAPGKQAFFSTILGRLAKGGTLVIFEPASREGESRQESLDRFVRLAHAHLPGHLEPQELDAVCAHVTGHDYPESSARFGELARAAGFPSFRLLYQDPDELVAVMAFET